MEVAHGKDHHYVAEVKREIEEQKWRELVQGGTDRRESDKRVLEQPTWHQSCMLCITYSPFTAPSGCHGCRKTLCFVSSFRCFCVQSFCSRWQPSFVSAAVALRKIKVSVFVLKKKKTTKKHLPSLRSTRQMGNLLIPTFWHCIACDADVGATLYFPSLFDIIMSLTAAMSVSDVCVTCY